MSLISAKDLTKTHAADSIEVKALQSVNFEIKDRTLDKPVLLRAAC